LKTDELLDDSSIFNSVPEQIIHLCPIFPNFREECGSEQIHERAQISRKPPTGIVERFLSILRLYSREK
jgi:hypothetical protein